MNTTQRLLWAAAFAVNLALATTAQAVGSTTPMTVAGEPTLQAVANNGVCESGEFCMYSGDHWTGYVYDVAGCDDDRSHRFENFPGTSLRLADNVESVANYTIHVYGVYDRTQFGGNEETINPGHWEDSIGSVEDDNRSHQCLSENGVCDGSELCMYSGDNFTGYVYDFITCEDTRSHLSLTFPGSGGMSLVDNVQSVRNQSAYFYRIYDRAAYAGNFTEIVHYADVDSLGTVEKDNRSHKCIAS